MTAATCFDTKVPSSGTLSTTQARELRVGPTKICPKRNSRACVVDKVPDDGTLVSKHVAAGILCEVYFVICFIVFYLVNVVGF